MPRSCAGGRTQVVATYRTSGDAAGSAGGQRMSAALRLRAAPARRRSGVRAAHQMMAAHTHIDLHALVVQRVCKLVHDGRGRRGGDARPGFVWLPADLAGEFWHGTGRSRNPWPVVATWGGG